MCTAQIKYVFCSPINFDTDQPRPFLGVAEFDRNFLSYPLVPLPHIFGCSLEAVLESKLDKVVVEEAPFIVTYDTVAGGTVRKERENHLRNHTEAVLLMHKRNQSFTCNNRVVPGDIHGVAKGPLPKAKQVMTLQSLPNGAPDGGPRVVFPPQVCGFLIGR